MFFHMPVEYLILLVVYRATLQAKLDDMAPCPQQRWVSREFSPMLLLNLPFDWPAYVNSLLALLNARTHFQRKLRGPGPASGVHLKTPILQVVSA